VNHSYFFALAIALIVALAALQSWRRRQQMKRLALHLGFTYLGEALPFRASLSGTELEGVSAVWNVIEGQVSDIHVVAFDCRVGQGKASWRATAIAVEAEGRFDPVVLRSNNLRVERSGEWYIYRRKKGFGSSGSLMSLNELDGLIRAAR
jgi:hypothetical protein